MGTRIRDKASNTDSSIILDSGTSYVKRDDQTVPVYRGITSTNLIGAGGWTWLNREQRDAAGAWYGSGGYWVEANVADWGIPVGATAVKFNYRWSGSSSVQMAIDWYGNDTQATGTTSAPDQSAEGFHDRWLQFRDEVNLAGQIIGWPSATGRCLYRRSDSSGTLDMYPIGYQMTPGTSATQTNLDAALARITELENNAGGQFKVGSYSRSTTGRQTVDVGFQPKRIVWYYVIGTSNFTVSQIEWYTDTLAATIHKDTSSTNSGTMVSIGAGGDRGPTVTSTGFTTYHINGGDWPTGVTTHYTAWA